jgi:hypothetical protein
MIEQYSVLFLNGRFLQNGRAHVFYRCSINVYDKYDIFRTRVLHVFKVERHYLECIVGLSNYGHQAKTMK